MRVFGSSSTKRFGKVSMDKKIYKVMFYREMLCEVDVTASSVEEAEKLFREGYANTPTQVPNTDTVDEICSIEVFDKYPNQMTLLN